MPSLAQRIKAVIRGDVADDLATRSAYSHDTSIFERLPSLVVFPKSADDVSAVIRVIGEARARGEQVSLAARSAGTDMTGGDLTDSVMLVFPKYMNRMLEVGDDWAKAEPGLYYRDFEKETMAKRGMLLPSYPASRELCAIGGIVSNNSGGELTLNFGKTNDYVRELEVVLADGTHATLRALSENELAAKETQQDLEGDIYRKVHALIGAHEHEIEAARPTVTKNSAGYALWNVIDKKRNTFDLSQLVTGSQGTLAIVTAAKLGLVKLKEHRAMLVIFLSDMDILPEVVTRVLACKPESFESYDDKTLMLAVKFMPQMLRQMGLAQAARLGFSFIPEMTMVATGGIPKLFLLAEFAEDTPDEALRKVEETAAALEGLPVRTKIARSEIESAKYWKMRREAFALLRKRMKGLTAAPIMDDFVVHPKDYPQFLPELYKLLNGYSFTYAVTGHIGDGNFHIFPLVDMSQPKTHSMIMDLMPRIYDLVRKYGGAITGEHNDGIVRTPFLSYQFSPEMLDLFAQVKQAFDPLGILNPGKKVGGTLQDIERSMVTRSV